MVPGLYEDVVSFTLPWVDSSWICIGFSRPHCTSLLIPRASMCFSRWNPRCCSELKWYVRKLQRKPSLKKAGGTLLSATRSARWIRMAGNCASDAACLWDQQTTIFASSGVCPGLNRKNSQLQVVSVCCPCYILYYNIGIFTCTTVTFIFFSINRSELAQAQFAQDIH